MEQKKAIFNWSGGKDSALALHYVLQDKRFSVENLVTTVNSKFNRVSMLGVRNELLEMQGKEIGIPIQKIELPESPSMEDYNRIMEDSLSSLCKGNEITHSIFGDIFLEDLKKYREEKLKEVGLKAYFPLWKRNTREVVNEFIDLGFKTMVVCVKSELLSEEFAGRVIDKEFLKDLPKNVDPCGENGEFHTFVFDGPLFKNPIQFEIGEKIYTEYEAPKTNDHTKNNKPYGFHFCDLKPIS